MSEELQISDSTGQIGHSSNKKDASTVDQTVPAEESSVEKTSQNDCILDNSEKVAPSSSLDADRRKDSVDGRDKSRKNKSRSRSRGRHQRESPARRDKKQSRSGDYRSRRSRSRRKSRSRSRDRRSRSKSRERRRKSRSPERKRYRSRSTDKKSVGPKNGEDETRDSKSPSQGKLLKQRPHDLDADRRRRRSRSRDRGRYEGRDHRYRRSPNNKHGSDRDRNFDDVSDKNYPKYSNRKRDDQRYAEDKPSREACYRNDRKNEWQLNSSAGGSWSREPHQGNWAEKGHYLNSDAPNDVALHSKGKTEFEANSAPPLFISSDNSSNSAIPVLLSSNCKTDDQTFPTPQPTEGNFVKPTMTPNADGRLPAPPRMSIPPTNFKDGLPNVREPPPGFLPFRPDNPVPMRLRSEPPPPTFALLNPPRLSVRNEVPQQVLIHPLQVIRGPTKLEIPVDLRFLNPELRLPLYSTGIINRPMAQSPHVANIIGRVPVDQTRIVHQVQPRLVGVSQVSDIPPPPPPPQTFTITQTPSLPPNGPFVASGVPRLPDNVSFIANPPQLIFSSMGNRQGFITNLAAVNETLHPRIVSSQPPPPPPQLIIQAKISSALSHPPNVPINMIASLPAHSTADVQSKASAAKTTKPKQKSTGSEKYSPYSCSSGGSSSDPYTDALFDEPFKDIDTPLEEEEGMDLEDSHPPENPAVPSQGRTESVQAAEFSAGDRMDSQSSSRNENVRSLVDLPGIAKSIDLASTLNMIHVNDLKKVLETAASNSVTRVKRSEMSSSEAKSSKAQRMDQIAEEVKLALKPHFSKNLINKDEYKDIMRRAVPKIFGSRSTPDSTRIQAFVQEYVNKMVKSRKSGKIKNTTAHGTTHDKKQSSKIPMKA